MDREVLRNHCAFEARSRQAAEGDGPAASPKQSGSCWGEERGPI